MDKFYKWLKDKKKKNPEKFETVTLETRIGYMISFLIDEDDYIREFSDFLHLKGLI